MAKVIYLIYSACVDINFTFSVICC